MKTEDDYREDERERIIDLLTLHRSEIRVCAVSFDGLHPMLTREQVRAYLEPKE